MGLRYMAAGAFFFSVMTALVKLVSRSQPTMQIVLGRSVVVAVIAGAILAAQRRSPIGVEWKLLLMRGLFGFMALTLFYYALRLLPLADATMIHFTNPVFTTLLAAVVLGELIHLREITLTLTSLLGVVMVARPTFLFGGTAAALNPVGVGLALAGAVLSAAAYVAVRRLRGEHTMVIVLYFAGVSVVLSLPLVIATWEPPSVGELWLLLGIGVATYLGQLFLTMGLQRERAGRATAVGYLQIVFAGAWGALFFGEIPDLWSVGGALLIVGSTYWLARAHEPRVPPSGTVIRQS